MIDLTKPVQRRDGRPARIVSDKAGGMFPVMAIVTDEVTGREWMQRHTLAGSATGVPGESPNDLVNVPERQPTEEFRNIYLKGFYEGSHGPEISHPHMTGGGALKALQEQDAPDSFTIKISRDANGHIEDVKFWNYDPAMPLREDSPYVA